MNNVISNVFGTLGVATSGMGVYKTWLNAVADNVANLNNVVATDQPAFRERFVLVEPMVDASGNGAGARVSGVEFGDPEGLVTYEPDNALADDKGMVRRPDVDLTDQMVYMQLAQRGYQANVATFEHAKNAYETILSIGR